MLSTNLTTSCSELLIKIANYFLNEIQVINLTSEDVDLKASSGWLGCSFLAISLS